MRAHVCACARASSCSKERVKGVRLTYTTNSHMNVKRTHSLLLTCECEDK